MRSIGTIATPFHSYDEPSFNAFQKAHVGFYQMLCPIYPLKRKSENSMHRRPTLYFATDATSQKAGNIRLNNKVSVAIASEEQDFYKLRGLSMSGLATRVDEKQRAEELSLRLFQALPQSKRYVREDPKQLAVYEIRPVLHFGLRQDLFGRAIGDFASKEREHMSRWGKARTAASAAID
jgi:hypothetical protein